MRILTILFLATLLSSVVHAQDEDTQSEYNYSEETTDDATYNSTPDNLQPTKSFKEENVTLRKFDSDKWRKVVGSTNYRENKAKKKKSESDQQYGEASDEELRRRMRELEEQAEDEDDDEDYSFSLPFLQGAGLLIQALFYIVIAALIALILYFIFKNIRPAPKKLKEEAASATTNVEDIADLDIDSLLAKTLASGDYRLAIRISFLGLLKKLNEVGFIVWKKDKTNREYLNELYTKAKYFNEVRRLTLAYETVWYGEHAIPAELYHQYKAEFNDIDQQLNAAKPQ